MSITCSVASPSGSRTLQLKWLMEDLNARGTGQMKTGGPRFPFLYWEKPVTVLCSSGLVSIILINDTSVQIVFVMGRDCLDHSSNQTNGKLHICLVSCPATPPSSDTRNQAFCPVIDGSHFACRLSCWGATLAKMPPSNYPVWLFQVSSELLGVSLASQCRPCSQCRLQLPGGLEAKLVTQWAGGPTQCAKSAYRGRRRCLQPHIELVLTSCSGRYTLMDSEWLTNGH